jgi:hypothetical protein
MLELRTLTWWLATRGTRIGLDRVPSAALVEGLLAEWGKEKKDASRKRKGPRHLPLQCADQNTLSQSEANVLIVRLIWVQASTWTATHWWQPASGCRERY